MERKIKQIVHAVLALLVCCLCLVWVTGMKADAASRMKPLKIGKTYTSKLDGKTANKIRCTYSRGSNDYNKYLNIYIDGKKQLTLTDWSYNWDVVLCKISSKTIFYVRDNSDNGWCAGLRLYEYSGGKLQSLGNLADITRDYKPLSGWARGSLVKVGKNSLTVKWSETTKSTGIIDVIIEYKVRSGQKAEKKGKSFTVKGYNRSNSWTAKKKIPAYLKIGGKKRVFTVMPGEKVKIVRMAVKNKKQYLQLQNAKGKKGWYRDGAIYSGGWYKVVPGRRNLFGRLV